MVVKPTGTRTLDVRVFPKRPLLNSQTLDWKGGVLQHHCQPAGETPYTRSIPTHHSIIVHHTQAEPNETNLIPSEQWLDDGQQVRLRQPGDISIIPANTLTRNVWHREVDFSLLWLDSKHISQIAYEAVDPDRIEIIPRFAAPDPLMYQLILGLRSELELGESCSLLYVDSLITTLSLHLIRKYSVTKPLIQDYTDGLPKRKLQQAISFINENLTENLSLDDISKIVEMSPHYFTSLFKQSTGMSAYQYIIQCRIERAKELLCKQDLSIAEVSKKVGFQNQSHFSNVFHKHTGTTPKRYRDAKS
jgi:AraC family transcriptional regulator